MWEGSGGEGTGRGRVGQIRDGGLAPNPCTWASGMGAEVAQQALAEADGVALCGAAVVPP